MANLSKAFSVLSRACDRLARMGVVDVHSRITARILPPEKCGAEDRALELAQEAIAELHQRGLEVLARDLSLELEVAPMAPARLAGSTPVESDFLSPPPIARAIGSAVLRAADALFPRTAAPGEPLPSAGAPELPVTVPAPEAPVPPLAHEVSFDERIVTIAGAKVGIDFADGPDRTEEVRFAGGSDRTEVVPPAAGYAPGELEELQRQIDAEEAGKDRAHHEALDGAEADAERAAAQAELPSGQVLPDDLPPLSDSLGGLEARGVGEGFKVGEVRVISHPDFPVPAAPPSPAELDAEALRREADRKGGEGLDAPRAL